MASEQRLYTFSQETRDRLRKFRLGTSRSKEPQAVIYQIDKSTLAIEQEADETVYTSLQSLADALPDNSPRFVLLSYPLTLASGRQAAPYVLLSYMPSTCNASQRMLYASARELMRREAETSRVIELDDAEDVEAVEEKLTAED